MRLFLILATFTALLVYGGALEAPLYLDDYAVLGGAETLHWGTRALGYASFWLSRQFADALGLVLSFQFPFYFRLPNILIHILAATAVFWMTRELTGRRLSAALAGALFLVHPIQTQAVTYISQRFESLAALFMIVAATAYIRMRKGGSLHWLWVIGAAWVAAALTKETAVALPAWIILIELVFFDGIRHLRKPLYWIPLVLLMLVTLLIAYPSYMAYRDSKGTLLSIPFEYYLLSQATVLLTYLKLAVFPVRQFLLYGDQPATALTMSLALQWAAILAIVGFGIYLCRRRPIVGFGVLTFFVLLSPTSVMPLPDLIFEHRVYPAFAGLAIAAACAFEPNRRTAAFFAVLLAALGIRSAIRNAEWNDRVAFFEAHRREFPEDSKTLASLGNAYAVRGEIKRAIEVNQAARRHLPTMNPYYYKSVTVITDTNLAMLYLQAGNNAAAREEALRVLSIEPDQTTALTVLGNVQLDENQFEQARTTFEKIRRLSPRDDTALKRLALLNSSLGDTRKAEEIQRTITSIKEEARVEEIRRQTSPAVHRAIVFGLIFAVLAVLLLMVWALIKDLPPVWRWLRTGSVLAELPPAAIN